MAAWRYEIFQHLKRNFVSLRGHVISSICMDNLWSKGTHTSEPKHFQQCEFPPPPFLQLSSDRNARKYCFRELH